MYTLCTIYVVLTSSNHLIASEWHNLVIAAKLELTVHGKILVGEKLANLVNHELFTKIFHLNIHRYTKKCIGICFQKYNPQSLLMLLACNYIVI